MYTDNEKKFTAVLNRRHPLPLLMNALGHLASGLTATLNGEGEFLDYPCPAGGFTAKVSRFPFIVLSADNGNQLRRLRDGAAEASLPHNVFVTSMLGPSAVAQVEATRTATTDDLDYVAVAVFGSAELLTPLTRKFSLFRA
ncbi:DUF2000 domain-containing protein [Blastococcus sp. PRF04-17]|uniref:DUF2000 domain-containing protein n=1 Tax=Blastococcus sp. PRF04-17 TaxID=2933797 RepID=UPI001FF37748|nr:DUF2000 domain-containing protein [Blastococcus sp. PRF04-17]UOY03721.1 DUF2000 domain-containing protein [Blastococcus sp. PRF04-17]